MSLCDIKKKFLFEALPDVFPPHLTDIEMALWGMYYDDQAKARK